MLRTGGDRSVSAVRCTILLAGGRARVSYCTLRDDEHVVAVSVIVYTESRARQGDHARAMRMDNTRASGGGGRFIYLGTF